MTRFSKMSVRFVPHEDRLAMICDAGDEGVQCLWLIRPLAQKLVIALTSAIKPKDPIPSHADLRDEFAQSSAESHFVPAPPVEPRPAPDLETHTMTDSHEAPDDDGPAVPPVQWLVRAMNIKVHRDAIALTFQGAEGQEGRFAFSEERLRQWLGIIRKVTLSAGWAHPDWPDWMKHEPEPPVSARQVH